MSTSSQNGAWRGRVGRSLIFGLVFLAGGRSLAAAPPTRLQVNFMGRPLGLDAVNADHLRFNWRVADGMQTAYQIKVGQQWDSGKVNSSQQNGILYTGPELAPKTAYSWQLKLWIDGKEADWVNASFETGILQAKDWAGGWVTSGASPANKTADPDLPRSWLVRQRFELPAAGKIAKARAYVAADHARRSFFGFRVNGNRPDDLRPLCKGVYTFDITRLLRPGENVFGAMFGAEGSLLCDVEVWFADGTRLSVGTGPQAKTAQVGPILSASEFDGETYDARREIQWSQPGFDDSGWEGCKEMAKQKPVVAVLDWVKPVEILKPVSITNPKPGMYVVDAGIQISGWEILKVNGPRGSRIQFRCAERLNADGTIDRATILNGLPAQEIDFYTLKGGGDEQWEPELTMHGFRYLEVTGFPGALTAQNISFRRLAGDVVGETARFECSNEWLNRLHRAFYDTELANAMFNQTDCNQRGERAPWSADAFCVAEAAMSYFDMPYFWQEKWLNISQRMVGPHGEAGGLVTGPQGFHLLWGSHAVRIPWDYYQAYGDRVRLAADYQRARKFTDCCLNWWDKLDEVVCTPNPARAGEAGQVIEHKSREDWLINAETPWKTANGRKIDNGFKPWGDWVRPNGRWYDNNSFINSAAYFRCVDLTAKMAAVLGKAQEAAHYAEVAEKIRTAINAKWLVEDGQTAFYCDNDQTPNALALHYGIVPEARREAVLACLIQSVKTNGNHLTTGSSGTLSIVPALAQNGRDDLVFTLATQKTEPSWLSMIERGPGTLWEHWTEKDRSKCHPFLGGSIAAWLHQEVAGIKPLKPGYEQIEIRPVLAGDVTFCKATVPTIRGPVSVEWKIQGGQFRLTVVIPGNTTAKVYLPGEKIARDAGPGSHQFDHPLN